MVTLGSLLGILMALMGIAHAYVAYLFAKDNKVGWMTTYICMVVFLALMSYAFFTGWFTTHLTI